MGYIDSIVREFEEKYGLESEMVLEVVQRSLEAQMIERYGRHVVVDLDDEPFGVYVIGYQDGVPDQYRIPPEKIRGLGTIHRRLSLDLERAVVARDYVGILPYENTVVRGEILLLAADGTLYVEAEIRAGEPITCICPKRNIPKRERGEGFMRGERRAFFIAHAKPIEFQGTPRLQVVLSRTSLRLPVLLLEQVLKQHGTWSPSLRLKAVRRICGAMSIVAVSDRIPRTAILEVACEIGERVRIITPPESLRYLVGAQEPEEDAYLGDPSGSAYDTRPLAMIGAGK